MEDGEAPKLKRIRLTGDRFDGGRLPVDSLVELQRYQDAVRRVAEHDWKQENPGEELPVGLGDSVSLTITKLGEGSADILLAFEQHTIAVQYQQDAQDVVDGTLAAAYGGTELPQLPDEISERVRVEAAEFGSTLEPGESIEIYPGGNPDAAPVIITVEARKDAIVRLELEGFLLDTPVGTDGNVLQKVEETLVGRFTELDADDQKFRFVSLLHGPLTGRFTSSALTADIRKLLDSSTVAPVTRIVGDLQYRNGIPWRLRDLSLVEEMDIDNDRWGTALVGFASLAPGWGENEDGKAITFTSLEAARDILRAIDSSPNTGPGLFPTASGGVLIEWSSAEHVRSIEISADAVFELFDLPSGSFESTYAETKDIRRAISFATGGDVERADK